jgi:glycosyltransferase involved in cell wall biosynthesis
VPVVGFSSGALPEIIESGVSGILVAPNDFAAIAQAVEQILGDNKLKLSLVEGARERLKLFSAKEHARKCEEVYFRLLG